MRKEVKSNLEQLSPQVMADLIKVAYEERPALALWMLLQSFAILRTEEMTNIFKIINCRSY